MIFFLLLATVASFLQSTIISIDMVTAMVLWAIIAWRPNRVWPAAFISGIFLDLIAGFPMGISSLIFLTTALIWWLYNQKYQSFHPIFLFTFTSSTFLIFNYATRDRVIWIQTIIWGIIFTLFRKFLIEFQIDRSKLKV